MQERVRSNPEQKITGFDIVCEASTQASPNHPDRNEDAYFVSEATGTFCACDGVGGREGSEAASLLVAQTIEEAVSRWNDIPVFRSDNEAVGKVRLWLHGARTAVINNHPGTSTTASILQFYYDRNDMLRAAFATVGDTRIALLRRGILEAISVDHTPAFYARTREEAIRLQAFYDSVSELSQMTPEQACLFYSRNDIYSVVGGGNFIMDSGSLDVQFGDRFALYTDHVTDNLTTEDIRSVLSKYSNGVTQFLLQRATTFNKTGRTYRSQTKAPDDGTAIVVDVVPLFD